MEYIEQIEKLLEFFNSNLSSENLEKINALRQKYQQDYNLIGSFVKDFLCAKNNYTISDDDKICQDFIKYFEDKKELIFEKEIIDDFIKYSNYYLVLLFENCSMFGKNEVAVEMNIATINTFYIMELYPFLINLFNSYFNLKIDGDRFILMLKSIVDIILEKYENSQMHTLDLRILDYEINKRLIQKDFRRLAG